MDRVRKDPFVYLQALRSWVLDTLRNPMQLISVLGFVFCLVAGFWM